MSSARHAFTLLEMAIVITIIGILLGGLVATRSFLHNAELNNLVNEAKFNINAFDQFRERYGAVPGDMPNASQSWTDGIDGDGNGMVRSTDSVGLGNAHEIFLVFQHLSRAGLIMGNYTGATTGTTGTLYAKIGTNMPGTPIANTAFMFDHTNAGDGVIDGSGGIHTSTAYFNGLYGHVLFVAGLQENALGVPNENFLTPKEMYQIDEKYDDGMPGGGWVLSQKYLGGSADCATAADPATALYNVTYKGPACYMILKLQ